MKRILAAMAVAALAIPAAAAAQANTLPAGKWTGTVTPPGEAVTAITFDVTVAGDSIGITLNAGEHGTFVTQNVKVADGKLTFTFFPGPEVNCTLTKGEDSSWSGECLDPDGDAAQITMQPPKSEGG